VALGTPMSSTLMGGLMSYDTSRFPVRTCPVGAVLCRRSHQARQRIGEAAAFPDLVTFDVCGTSTDVSLVECRQGRPSHRDRIAPAIRAGADDQTSR